MESMQTTIRSDLVRDLIETLLRYRAAHPDLSVAEALVAAAMVGPAAMALSEKDNGDAK